MSSSQRLDATDRVNLLLSFVPYLLDHSPISVTDLATAFDTRPEAVRELIRLLAVSGVPGDSGMYQHQDLFDIDWDAFENDDEVVLWNHIAVDATPRLSQLEAASLIAGLQYISGLMHGNESDVIARLITKLSKGAHSQPQPISITASLVPDEVTLINQAIASDVSVEFNYVTRGQSETRRVDPIRLDLVGQQWYLRGWCHLRGSLRTFRLSRMSDLFVNEIKRITQVKPADLPDELFDLHSGLITITCIASVNALSLISEYQPGNVREGENGKVTFDIQLGSVHSVIGLVTGTAGAVTILSPSEAQDELREWARAAVDYQLESESTA